MNHRTTLPLRAGARRPALRALAAAAVLPLALTLTACSGGSESAEDAAEPASATASPGAEETAEAVAEVEESTSPEQELAAATKELKAAVPSSVRADLTLYYSPEWSGTVLLAGKGAATRASGVVTGMEDVDGEVGFRVADGTFYALPPTSEPAWTSSALDSATVQGSEFLVSVDVLGQLRAVAATADSVSDEGSNVMTIGDDLVTVHQWRFTAPGAAVMDAIGYVAADVAEMVDDEVSATVGYDPRGRIVWVESDVVGATSRFQLSGWGKVTPEPAPANAFKLD
ncbi:hypothetical protein [Nocardioides bruguierae]|uniref:hypothetical protein n=1 Tax=Nocardioides bruguierae TaxID=2945102 RepID=UPI002021CD34|nr:hypothetical protein [Nocardioides bruguierae]MCL8027283.1 hypothetical protein [Nocardioides bruguierae]